MAWPYLGWLALVALGLVGAGLARFLVVRFAPTAEGSGVQRVEAVFELLPTSDESGAQSSTLLLAEHGVLPTALS